MTTREVTDLLLDSYRKHDFGHNIGRGVTLNTTVTQDFIDQLLALCFPGYSPGYSMNSNLEWNEMQSTVQQRVLSLNKQLSELILMTGFQDQPEKGSAHTIENISAHFISSIPTIRSTLMSDVEAIHHGDPAAKSKDETILTNPGLFAITVQRFAHRLYELDTPILPRKMTELAHSITGIDIHPGASIGHSFLIDHGTGVVVGETSRIGNNVKIYQGVTLGALSFPRTKTGELNTKTKRHPTIKDNVTIYANATILGGDTIVHSNSTIGASAFVTKSVRAGSLVKFDTLKKVSAVVKETHSTTP